MKMEYVKPRILVERFTLTQSIAASCGVPAGGTSLGKPNSQSASTCGWDVGGMMIFTVNTTKNCTEDVSDGYEYEGMCYNNPANMPAFFSSF